MTTCKECLHLAVCGRYTATGGNVRECKHFVADNHVGGKWISVSERLPEYDGRYICNVKSFAFPGTFFQKELCFEYGEWAGGYEVTHWMPLPEPPKEVWP
jgi:hypothetical protein